MREPNAPVVSGGTQAAVTANMTTLQWRPITPVQPSSEHDFSQDDALRQQWLNQGLSAEHPGLTALHCSWTIYRLDKAQTQTLIAQGFELAAIPPSGAGQDLENLLVILRNHLTTFDAIYSTVRRGRSTSRTAIRQLHQTLCAHRPTELDSIRPADVTCPATVGGPQCRVK